MKKNLISKLVISTNSSFLDDFGYNDLLKRTNFSKEPSDTEKEEQIQNLLCDLFNSAYQKLTLKQANFDLIKFSSYKKYKRKEDEDNTIFEIIKSNGKFKILTNIYCGEIKLKDLNEKYESITIEIQTPVHYVFLKRMLNFCVGIYSDFNDDSLSNASKSIYSLIVQYLYLTSLRKASILGFPQKYFAKKDRDYSLKGNLSLEDYFNNDIYAYDKKITYFQNERKPIQIVIDLLYYALTKCKIDINNKDLPNLYQFKSTLRNLYSGYKPTKLSLRNIEKRAELKNELFSAFERPIRLAKLIVDKEDSLSDESGTTSSLNGFCIDSSFLWEMYLYNLLLINLQNWNVDSQSSFSFYENTFFKKTNYPDLVLTNKITGDIYVFDAKFKNFKYRGIDVDNDDLQQIHSYAYYYFLKYGEKFKGCGLIYPIDRDSTQQTESNIDNVFGIDQAKKFGTFGVKDARNFEELLNNEQNFIEEIRAFLGE